MPSRPGLLPSRAHKRWVIKSNSPDLIYVSVLATAHHSLMWEMGRASDLLVLAVLQMCRVSHQNAKTLAQCVAINMDGTPHNLPGCF